jgi:hypothetical protein
LLLSKAFAASDCVLDRVGGFDSGPSLRALPQSGHRPSGTIELLLSDLRLTLGFERRLGTRSKEVVPHDGLQVGEDLVHGGPQVDP